MHRRIAAQVRREAHAKHASAGRAHSGALSMADAAPLSYGAPGGRPRDLVAPSGMGGGPMGGGPVGGAAANGSHFRTGEAPPQQVRGWEGYDPAKDPNNVAFGGSTSGKPPPQHGAGAHGGGTGAPGSGEMADYRGGGGMYSQPAPPAPTSYGVPPAALGGGGGGGGMYRPTGGEPGLGGSDTSGVADHGSGMHGEPALGALGFGKGVGYGGQPAHTSRSDLLRDRKAQGAAAAAAMHSEWYTGRRDAARERASNTQQAHHAVALERTMADGATSSERVIGGGSGIGGGARQPSTQRTLELQARLAESRAAAVREPDEWVKLNKARARGTVEISGGYGPDSSSWAQKSALTSTQLPPPPGYRETGLDARPQRPGVDADPTDLAAALRRRQQQSSIF